MLSSQLNESNLQLKEILDDYKKVNLELSERNRKINLINKELNKFIRSKNKRRSFWSFEF